MAGCALKRRARIGGGFAGSVLFELQHLAVADHQHGFAVLDVAAQDRLGQRIFEVVLNRATQRTCALPR